MFEFWKSVIYGLYLVLRWACCILLPMCILEWYFPDVLAVLIVVVSLILLLFIIGSTWRSFNET